jgi:hypothetical protein
MTLDLGSDGPWFPWTAQGWIEEVFLATLNSAQQSCRSSGGIFPRYETRLLHAIADRNGENAT